MEATFQTLGLLRMNFMLGLYYQHSVLKINSEPTQFSLSVQRVCRYDHFWRLIVAPGFLMVYISFLEASVRQSDWSPASGVSCPSPERACERWSAGGVGVRKLSWRYHVIPASTNSFDIANARALAPTHLPLCLHPKKCAWLPARPHHRARNLWLWIRFSGCGFLTQINCS